MSSYAQSIFIYGYYRLQKKDLDFKISFSVKLFQTPILLKFEKLF